MLRELWCALTGRCGEEYDSQSVQGNPSCFYGVPMTIGPVEQDYYPRADWFPNYPIIDDIGVRQDGPCTLLCCDNPTDIKREVRVVQGDDINPVSGIPLSDKARKRLQLDTFLFEYFPDAFLAVAEVAIVGNEQHNPGKPMHWAREKSKDQFNTAFRHYWERRRGVHKDTDGQRHLAKAIWRLSAQLQLDIEAERAAERAEYDAMISLAARED